jgi:thiosulfate reductase/polysulfide reductase chain A
LFIQTIGEEIMDRRRFLEFTAGGAVGAALASSVSCVKKPSESGSISQGRHEIPTTCEMCVNKCSVIAVVENGKVKKLNPNPENPRSRGMVCARGNAGIQQLEDPSRIKKPLIRAGARGEGKWPVVVMRQPVVKPRFDTKTTLEIVQGLAKRLGLSEYFDYTIEQWVDAQVAELPVEAPLMHLRTHGVYVPPGGARYGTTLNPEHRFVTQSGKIELFSERLQTAGNDPLPRYTPPSQAPEGQLRVIVGRKTFFTHANTTNYPWLNAFQPENYLLLHPQTADAYRIAEGDLVEVTSTSGSLRIRAHIAQEIRPDCVFMMHGFGKRSKWQALVCNTSGSDAQILETAWDKVSGNAALHETFVRIRRV